MTTRYVGLGGNDGNSGLTWALRKLTLNGVEDTPVVAGDTVYVGPGVYREQLTCDVAGTSGNAIVYIGDVTGEHTDGVGGIVRITGTDNDQTTARTMCINGAGRSYRTFRGFFMNGSGGDVLDSGASATNVIIEDCVLIVGVVAQGIDVGGDAQSNWIIRRTIFMPKGAAYGIRFDSTGIANAAHLVENCMFIGGRGINVDDVGGITIRNILCVAQEYGVRVTDALPGGYTPVTVNNSIFSANGTALRAIANGEIVENYNNLHGNTVDRTNVDTGANSVLYIVNILPPILLDGFKFPWWLGELNEWSQVRAIAGTGEAADDLLGITRPVTSSKKSWGPIQFVDAKRSTAQAQAGSASMVLNDAGRIQLIVPTTAVSTTISVYVYREADYAGTNPQMVIKQPGQADRTTTDAGAASQWNQLSDTFTPAASPPYVTVELVSNNAAVAGSYAVYFDTLAVS